MEKVECADCLTEVTKDETVLVGHDIICKECIRLDVTDLDLHKMHEQYLGEREVNVYLH